MKKQVKKHNNRFSIPKYFLIFVLIFTFLFVLFFLANKKTAPVVVKITPEKTSETAYWKTYHNNDFYFSFKYPDYILSNFQVETFSNTYQKVKGIAQLKDSSSKIPSYNVFFEANAWKYNGNLDNFVKKGPLKIAGMKTQEVIINDNRGIRVTNTNFEKQEVYFCYNIFKKDNYIYNFALISDDKVLIDANIDLLNKIISTAKFFPTP